MHTCTTFSCYSAEFESNRTQKKQKTHILKGYRIVLLWTVSSHPLPVVIERMESAENEKRSSMSTTIRGIYTRPAVQRITLSAPSLSYRRAPITNKTWPERQSYIYEKKKKKKTAADGVLSFYQTGTVRDVGHQTAAQDRGPLSTQC